MKNDGLSPKNKVFCSYIKVISISYLGPTPIPQHLNFVLSQDPVLFTEPPGQLWLLHQVAEKVIPLVIHEDEGREVDDFDLPHRFHTEFRVVDTLNLFDVFLGKNRCRSTD